MPILEKAYAKFNVNYLNLQGGQTGFALRELTGMPSSVFRTHMYSTDKIWNMFKEWDQKKYIVGGSCTASWGGLTAGHAYSLIGAYEINGVKVFKMRYPWASERYTGPWSDRSREWNGVSKSVKD